MPFQIGIKLDTGNSLHYLLERDPSQITQRLLDETTEQAAWDYVTLLRKYTPVSKGPAAGNLWRSWFVRRTGQARFMVGNDAKNLAGVPYLVFVMRGHGWIFPKKPGGWLRFVIWPGGRVVFTRKVKPLAPNPFVQKAADEWDSQMGKATLNAAARKIAPWWMGKIPNPYTPKRTG